MGATLSPTPLGGGGVVDALETRYSPDKCYHTKFRRLRSNRFGVRKESQKFRG